MRIAFFVQYNSPNGTYFRWHNLAIALKHLGHEIDVYAGDHNYKSKVRHEVRDGIDYFIVPCLQSCRLFYSPNDPFTGIRRLLFLPKKRYEVYHLFQPFLQAYIPWRFLKWKKKDAVFIYDWDDLWIDGLLVKTKNIREYYFKKVTAILEKKIAKISDGVTVCSNFLLERIETSVFKIIIGNGFWKTCIPDKNAMRIKWGLEKDMFYVAYIGKTANELNWAIDAINCIDVALQPKTTLIIAGPPKALIEKLLKKTSDNIIYLGELTVEQARELASASDLGLIPLENSLFNQSRFPIKFFDFLTVGTPIYLSNVGEIALLSKSLDYVFCGSNNKKEWIKQFSEVVEKGSIALKSNEKDIAFIESYQWTHLAKKQLSFYQTAIEDKS